MFGKYRLFSLAYQGCDDQIHGYPWNPISISDKHPSLEPYQPIYLYNLLTYQDAVCSFVFPGRCIFFLNCLSFLIYVDNISNTFLWETPFSWSHDHPLPTPQLRAPLWYITVSLHLSVLQHLSHYICLLHPLDYALLVGIVCALNLWLNHKCALIKWVSERKGIHWIIPG